MANLPEAGGWVSGIYQIEKTDPVVGGEPNLSEGLGIANVQAQQLAQRTAHLKALIDAIDVDGDIQAAINALVAGSPGALDTLNELAAALGDDPNFATTITNLIATKLDASAYTAADILSKLKTVDGAGSGLDADLLDGNSAAHFAHSGRALTAGNGLSGGGNLTADRTFSVNFASTAEAKAGTVGNKAVTPAALKAVIDDVIAGAPGALDTLNELAAALGDDPNFAATISAQIGSKLNASAYTAADVLSKLKTVDGPGSGLNADLLDGKSAAEFLLASAYTASDVRSKLKTVDGAGSDIDADKLDGQHGEFYRNAGSLNAGTLNVARIPHGTTANKIVKLDGSGRLPAVDGSQLTGLHVRAWVNFNGTGTVTIRESYNVSSVTDNGTAHYQVNFIDAMPDANYATIATASGIAENTNGSTTSVAIKTRFGASTNSGDLDPVCVAIFR